MSTHFTVRCTTHDKDGPEIRRSAGGVGLLGYPTSDGWSNASESWAGFLIEHQWCELVLYSEYAKGNLSGPPAIVTAAPEEKS